MKKAFYIEVLNEHKAGIMSALKKIFASDFWLMRYNIPYRLTLYLDYFYDDDELAQNSNLLLKHIQVISNIGYVEAPGINFIDRVISQKLEKIPCQLIAQFKSSLAGYIEELLFISIEKKWSGDY